MKKSVVLIHPDRSKATYFQPYVQNLGWNLTCFDSVDKAIPYISTHELHDVLVDKRHLGNHIYDMDRLVLSAGEKCKLYFYSSGLPQKVKKIENVVYIQKELNLNAIAKHFVCPVRFLDESYSHEDVAYPLIGSSPETNGLKDLISSASNFYEPLFLKGPSGVGKRYFAKSLHCQNSSIENFVSLTGKEAALDFGSNESILRQPVYQRKTIYISEFDALSLEEQLKLLEHLFVHKKYFVNYHRFLLASTENSFDRKIESYLTNQLNGDVLSFSPLKDRPKDIYDQVRYFSFKYKEDETQLILDDEPLQLLLHHNWAGNSKQLKDTIAKAFLDAPQDKLTLENLQSSLQMACSFQETDTGVGKLSNLESIEVQYINFVLDKTKGNISRAANILEITRNTLKGKLKKSKEYDCA